MVGFPLGVHGRRLLAAALLALVLVVVAWRHAAAGHALAGSGPAGRLRVAPIVPARSAAGGGGLGGGVGAGVGAGAVGAASRSLLVVDVAGAVRRPGLVRVAQGARVADVVARAGGLARRADRAAVNFAAPVADGQQVLVPVRGSPGGPVVGGAAAGSLPASSAAPVSLSTATAEQLDTLPGVGPVTAQKIVSYRAQHGPFHSVDELDAIPGIGPARIADLSGLVVP